MFGSALPPQFASYFKLTITVLVAGVGPGLAGYPEVQALLRRPPQTFSSRRSRVSSPRENGKHGKHEAKSRPLHKLLSQYPFVMTQTYKVGGVSLPAAGGDGRMEEVDICASYRELAERARRSLVDMRQDFDAQAAELEAEREVFKRYKLKAKKKARGQDRANQSLREALYEIKGAAESLARQLEAITIEFSAMTALLASQHLKSQLSESRSISAANIALSSTIDCLQSRLNGEEAAGREKQNEAKQALTQLHQAQHHQRQIQLLLTESESKTRELSALNKALKF